VARDFRLIPTKRLIFKLGLHDYDRPAPLDFDEYKSSYVEIPMSQHIGRPSQPIVSAGEQVKKGQLIAVIPENSLGAAIHASIDGVVVKVDEKSIAIKVGDYE